MFTRITNTRRALTSSSLALTFVLWSATAAAQHHPVVPPEDVIDEAASEPVVETAPEVETSQQVLTPTSAPTLPAPASFLTRSHVRAALVDIRTAWHRGLGFLVGDRRTVITVGRLRDHYRRISVRSLGTEDPEVDVASVEVMEHGESTFVVLHLEADVNGQPLEISTDQPRVGDSTFVLLRRGASQRGQVMPDNIEAAEAAVVSASTTTLTVGVADSQIWVGSPLFDGAGRLVGFFGSEGFAVRASVITDPSNLRSGRTLISPIIGLRVGTEFGGELVDPFDIDLELGMALWDQLGIVIRIGAGIGRDVVAPYIQTEDTIVTAMADQRTLNLALELKYRLLINRSGMPMYLDFVAGLQYTMTNLTFHEIAIAQDADCDPVVMDCDQQIGFADGRRTFHGVGAAFGADIRAGVLTIGYRLVHEALAYQLSTVHRLTFGISFR